jgi:integrase/recombinase XerD
MDKNTIKIKDLANEFYDELDQRGYGQNVKFTYHKECRQILEWCFNNQIEHFNEMLGKQFCDETIGGHLSKPGSSYRYRNTLRVVRMLVTLQCGGDFEFRAPRIEYNFHTFPADVIDSYLDYCSLSCKLAYSTLSERKRMIFRFDNYLYDNHKQAEDISGDLFEDFLSKHSTKSARCSYKSVFRKFYGYLYDSGNLDKDFSSLILKEPKLEPGSKLPTTYTEEEIRKMIIAVDRSSSKGKRDYLVLLLAAEYGLRASDIASFSIGQIDWDRNKILIVQKKTSIPIEFPLLASVGNAVIDYLKHGRPSGGDNVIIVNHENTHKGRKLTSSTIHSIIAHAMKTANIKNWKTKKHGPHALRHSLASNMLKQNISIPIIKTVLGHQSTEVTKTYISVDVEKLRLCSLQIPTLTSPFYNLKTQP